MRTDADRDSAGAGGQRPRAACAAPPAPEAQRLPRPEGPTPAPRCPGTHQLPGAVAAEAEHGAAPEGQRQRPHPRPQRVPHPQRVRPRRRHRCGPSGHVTRRRAGRCGRSPSAPPGASRPAFIAFYNSHFLMRTVQGESKEPRRSNPRVSWSPAGCAAFPEPVTGGAAPWLPLAAAAEGERGGSARAPSGPGRGRRGGTAERRRGRKCRKCSRGGQPCIVRPNAVQISREDLQRVPVDPSRCLLPHAVLRRDGNRPRTLVSGGDAPGSHNTLKSQAVCTWNICPK